MGSCSPPPGMLDSSPSLHLYYLPSFWVFLLLCHSPSPSSTCPADASFRNLTRPAVLKDAGVIIEPIRYSKHIAEEHHGGGKAVKASKRPAVATVAGGMPKRSKAARK